MSTLDLLNGLQDYLTLLSALKDHELKYSGPDGSMSCETTLSYSFITLKVKRIKKEPNERNDYTIYLECTFEIVRDSVILNKIYCENRGREAAVREFISGHLPVSKFPTTTNFNNYSSETHQYFEIADVIARESYLCSGGDDYRPGYFSKITVDESRILLEQVNWKNAKSLAHRDDYTMRNLTFTIPLLALEKKAYLEETFHIGDMEITFSDRSSSNNKECGDRILLTIQDEKDKFKRK